MFELGEFALDMAPALRSYFEPSFCPRALVSTTKGGVYRKNCSVGSCGTAPQQSASTVKWLISIGHFPALMAVKMHNVVLRLFWIV
jgi:hypothetical protein